MMSIFYFKMCTNIQRQQTGYLSFVFVSSLLYFGMIFLTVFGIKNILCETNLKSLANRSTLQTYLLLTFKLSIYSLAVEKVVS